MKTTGRENQKPWARAFGAEVQNRSCLNKWAAKQEKFQPLKVCFFLTAPFIELTRRFGFTSELPVIRPQLTVPSGCFFSNGFRGVCREHRPSSLPTGSTIGLG